MYEYTATVERIVDGDTIDLDFDLGFDVHVRHRVRLKGVDTPETYGVKKDSEEYQKGLAAKKYVESKMPIGSIVIVKTYKDKKGKYGRILAEVYPSADTFSINDRLLWEGHAKKYE